MGKFIVRRLLMVIPILLLVSVLAFGLVRMMPGGAAAAYLRASNIPPTDSAIAAAEHELGLDRPLVTQYLSWMSGLVRLDLGKSYYGQKDVAEQIGKSFQNTMWLTGISFVWLLLLAVPLGIGAARRPGGPLDHFARLFSFVGASTPSFLLGYVLVLVFALRLKWLPVFGAQKPESVILPSLTLAVAYVATYARVLRNSLLENMEKRYVLYGRVRGLTERTIVNRHVLRNSMIPVVTSLAVSFGHMLAGSVIVENVFSWPGMGRLMMEAIFGRDFPIIQGYVIVMALVFVAANLLSDLAIALINPQVRFEDM